MLTSSTYLIFKFPSLFIYLIIKKRCMKGRQSHFHTAAYQHGEIYISSLYYAFVLNCLLLKRLSFHTLPIWLKAVRQNPSQAHYILCLMCFLPLRQSLLLLKYILTIKSLLLQLQCNIFGLILQQVNFLMPICLHKQTKCRAVFPYRKPP